MTPQRSLVALARTFRSEPSALESYLDELEERFDRLEPRVRAFVAEPDRFSRLRREVEALRERYPEPGERPILFGLPIAVKDIFHVDGFETRAGSRVPPEEIAGPESAAVTRLRRAGALVLGKAATTEFAYFGPGPTRNPHDLERTPGGSSSGSAAAVGAGLAPLALGTQTIGSVSRPASYCGVVGYKPSYDRISREGVIPLSPSLDHVGLFTADVLGAELVASIVCDAWRRIEPAGRPRLAIPVGSYLEQAEESGRLHFAATVERLEARGFDVDRVEVLADFETIRRRHYVVVAAEAARAHAAWYENWRHTYHPKTRELIDRGLAIGDAELAAARDGRAALRERLEDAKNASGCDLWISPPAPGPAPVGLESTGDPVMNLPWSQAGLPTLALRAGAAEGMPMGLQLAAGWRCDEELMAWGSLLERELGSTEDEG